MNSPRLKPFVLWLTGLSGAGKTTIGRKIYESIKASERALVFLDGDLFREIMQNDLGHDHDARVQNAYRLSRMCRYLIQQEVSVVCCTMSLYPEIWEWNRAHINDYVQVYLKVSKPELARRDPKGLYRKIRNGEESNLVGVDLPFDEPTNSALVIDNEASSPEAIAQAVEKICAFLESR